jgi:hypothetical protein
MSDKSGYEIRQSLLGLAEGILNQNAQMHWEQTKQWKPITTEEVIVEAEKLYEFVKRKN